MSAAMLTRIELTDAMLHAAWAHLSPQRAHWPADFSLAMQHPLISRLVRIEAALQVRAQTGAALRERAPQLAHTAHHGVDRKRAAAADFDD